MAVNRLNFNFSDCVHVYYRDSSCSLCIDVCPVEGAITQDDYRILIGSEKCISCGACIGVCPSEAFSLSGFDVETLIETLKKEPILSCKKNLPCLSVLSVEDIVAAVLNRGSDIVFDTRHCRDCFISTLLDEINKKVNEANYILERIGVENRAITEDICFDAEKEKKNNRRFFLKNFGKAAAGLTFWALMPRAFSFDEEKNEKMKNIVEEKIELKRRKRFVNALNSLNVDFSQIELSVDRISFTSDKWIDSNRCTNCSVCYNICPTGALKAVEERLKILFQPKLCIKCRVCHEVCPEDCLHLKETLNMETFLKETEILAQHVMIPCEECLVPFSYKGDSTLCPRCRQLDEEIKDLFQMGE